MDKYMEKGNMRENKTKKKSRENKGSFWILKSLEENRKEIEVKKNKGKKKEEI